MASRKARRIATKAAEKQKRQRIIFVVGCVVLLGLLVVQGPKTIHMLTAKPPADEAHARPRPGATAAPATTPASPSVPATPGAPVRQTAAAVTGGIGIPDTTSEPTPGEGQLVSFNRFRSKDPFVQQAAESCLSDSTEGASCPSAPTSPTKPAPKGGSTTIPEPVPAEPPVPSGPGSGTSTTGESSPTVPPPAPTSATISVNGASESVAVKGSFPESDPTFTLVSLTRKVAQIGLVGGSYSSGAPTITLKVGKPVTLMNTADGTRYKIELVSVS